MAYEVRIPEWFNTRKAAQTVAWLALKAGGTINVLRATKLVYLADRESMKQREFPITGDNFVSMKYGPVNTYTYGYMCGGAGSRADQWGEYVAPRDRYTLALSRTDLDIESDLDELSRSDKRILEETWDQFQDIDRFDLADWTHKFCPEWRDPNGSSIPIDFATVFRYLGKEDPITLAEEIQAERAMRLAFSSGA
jgi:uncharacterized phage-associated protein